jgi:hypothetical protein
MSRLRVNRPGFRSWHGKDDNYPYHVPKTAAPPPSSSPNDSFVSLVKQQKYEDIHSQACSNEVKNVRIYTLTPFS